MGKEKVTVDHNKLKAQPQEENFSGKYKTENIVSQFLVENYFKSVVKLISQTEEIQSAHEIGVGEGFSTAKLKKEIPFLTGSEYVESLVPLARGNNPELNIFQESVYALKNKSNSIDLVLLLEVLEHLDFPRLALKEIKRVSKRYAIIGVPNEPLWRILNFCRGKYVKSFGNTPGHLNHWSKKELIKLVQEEFGKVLAVESPVPWTILLAEKTSATETI